MDFRSMPKRRVNLLIPEALDDRLLRGPGPEQPSAIVSSASA